MQCGNNNLSNYKKKEKKTKACKKLSHHVRIVALRQVLKLERILFDRQFGSDDYTKKKKKKSDETQTNSHLKIRMQNLGQI